MAKYLANSPRAYGIGYDEASALARMAEHARHDEGDGSLEVTIVQCEMDAEINISPLGVEVDGEVRSGETFELTDAEIGEIADLSGDLELLVDSTLADAPEVTDDD